MRGAMQQAEQADGGAVRSAHRRRTSALYRGMKMANRRFQDECGGGKKTQHKGGRGTLDALHLIVETHR